MNQLMGEIELIILEFVDFFFVSAEEYYRLGHEHQKHANNDDNAKGCLNSLLQGNGAVERFFDVKKLDKQLDYRNGFSAFPVLKPFDDDAERHVAER